MRLLALATVLGSLLSGGPICYFGVDLDQEGAKNMAKDLGALFKAEGAKVSFGTDILSTEILETMKTADGSCFSNGHFDCNGGIFFVYISTHGGLTADGKDTIIKNKSKGDADKGVKLSELAVSIAALIPECCTVVFAFDSCGADGFYNNFIKGGVDVNPNNPFKSVNSLVLAPNITNPDHACPGSPVGDIVTKSFGTKRTAKELYDYATTGQTGVVGTPYWDDPHSAYPVVAGAGSSDPNEPVPVPEPGTLVVLVPLAWLWGSRNRRRDESRRGAHECVRPL